MSNDLNFRGFAKIPLRSLHFQDPEFKKKHRAVNDKCVRRLQDVFVKAGCNRGVAKHAIEGKAEKGEIDEAIRQLGRALPLTIEGYDVPHIPLRSVECSNGLHRVRAAQVVLDPNDQWWPVKLYSKEVPRRPEILEEFSNEQPYTDGEIFRNFLLYQRSGDATSAARWMANLSRGKSKELAQLLSDDRFAAAFLALVDLPGLWRPIQLGTLHRLLTLKCEEEMLTYLEHIREEWTRILTCNGKRLDGSIVDVSTVERLQLLAPKYSDNDRQNLIASMDGTDPALFPDLKDDLARAEVLQNLLATRTLVPSLYTFFENLKYLEPCSSLLKELLGEMRGRSIQRSFHAIYFAPPRVVIQSGSPRNYLHFDSRSEAEMFLLSYVQLWLFAMRAVCTPRKEKKKQKPAIRRADQAIRNEVASLAMELGFVSSRIQEWAGGNTETALAKDFVCAAESALSVDIPQQSTEVISSILRNAPPKSSQLMPPALTDDQPLWIERRCGTPYEDDYCKDRPFLFLLTLLRHPWQSGPQITSFFVQRTHLINFFGLDVRQDDTILQGDNAQTTIDTDMIGGDAPVFGGDETPQDGAHTRMQHDLERCRIRISELEREAENSRQKEEELRAAQKALQQQVRLVRERDEAVAALQRKDAEHVTRHLQTSQQYHELNSKMVQLGSENAKLYGQVQHLQNYRAAIEDTMKSALMIEAPGPPDQRLLENHLVPSMLQEDSEISSKIRRMKAENDLLGEKLKDSEALVAEQGQQLDSLRSSVPMLRADIAKQGAQIAELDQQSTQRQQEYEAILMNKDTAIGRLQQDVHSLKEDYCRVDGQACSLTEQNERCAQQAQERLIEIERLGTELKERVRDRASLETTNTQLRLQVNQCDETIRSQQAEIERVHTQKTTKWPQQRECFVFVVQMIGDDVIPRIFHFPKDALNDQDMRDLEAEGRTHGVADAKWRTVEDLKVAASSWCSTLESEEWLIYASDHVMSHIRSLRLTWASVLGKRKPRGLAATNDVVPAFQAKPRPKMAVKKPTTYSSTIGQSSKIFRETRAESPPIASPSEAEKQKRPRKDAAATLSTPDAVEAAQAAGT